MTLVDSLGRERPLVRAEQTVFTSSVAEPRARPPAWISAYLVAGLGLGGLFAGLARGGRKAFGWAGSVWAMAAGAAGAVVTFLWAFTNHAAAYGNENLLPLSLLLVPLVVALPGMASRHGWAERTALVLGALVAISSLAGLLVQALPGFDQQNGEVLALAVPANLGLAWGIRRAVSEKQ